LPRSTGGTLSRPHRRRRIGFVRVRTSAVEIRTVFAAARGHGLKLVAHAGEEGPADYVWRRSICCMSTASITGTARSTIQARGALAAEKMTLTVCPLSNLKLCVVKNLKDHPLKRMLDLGLRATVNSDDPAYFGGYVNANFVAVAEALA